MACNVYREEGGKHRNGAGNNFYSPHYNHYRRVHTTGERNLNLNSSMKTFSSNSNDRHSDERCGSSRS